MEQLLLKNSDGQYINADIICTFETEEDGKKYIVYTENNLNNENKIIVQASYYEQNGDILNLSPLEESDLYLVEDAINRLKTDYVFEK